MTTAPAGLELRPLIIPASADAPDAADFVEMTRVRNIVYGEISGNRDEDLTPSELLPAYATTPDEIRHIWAVVLDGRIVGRAGLDIPLEKGSRVAYWLVELLRESWGRGAGSAAYALIERTAREHGRSVLQSWAEHPEAPGERVQPPTAAGSIPRDHAARFYERHGFVLEQVERHSALDLSAPGTSERIDGLLAQAADAAHGYRVVRWQLPTPDEFIQGYAHMKSRMSTDAPAAGMEFDEQAWDAERVARHDRVYLDAGRTMLVTAAQHVDSGELVAFNELVVAADRTLATYQEDTLVRSDHRGHRLGMLVKCAGLVAWREVAPESPRVHTWNAEENRPMLDINEAIGFAPVAYNGAWKKVLDA